jgi:hypothetical protein
LLNIPEVTETRMVSDKGLKVAQLFRPEVAAARKADWVGTILLTTPKMVWPITLLNG